MKIVFDIDEFYVNNIQGLQELQAENTQRYVPNMKHAEKMKWDEDRPRPRPTDPVSEVNHRIATAITSIIKFAIRGQQPRLED